MTNNFDKPFKESDKIDLVSDRVHIEETPSMSSDEMPSTSLAEMPSTSPAEMPSTSPAEMPSASSDETRSESETEQNTPWKKSRSAKKNHLKSFLAISLVLVVAICGALYCVVLSIPNGPALIMSQVGVVIGNRWLVLKAFEIGYQNSPYNVSTFMTWANERAAYNKVDALQLYDDCIALNPKYAPSYLNRGVTHYYLKQFDDAMADYNKAIALNPRYGLALDHRANLWVDSGELEQALADETAAIACNQELRRCYLNRGKIYRKLNRYDEAIADFEKSGSLGMTFQRVQAEIKATRDLMAK